MESPDLSKFKPRMEKNKPDEINGRRTVLLSLSFFIVLLAWSYFNFKVPTILDDLLAGITVKQTLKGIIMAMDNLIAVILQPYFGDLSDRTHSKWGRRMPFIIIGTCAAAVFLATMAWVQFLAGFIIIIFLFDLAMSTFRSVSIAILPDYTPDSVRSKGSSIQQFLANLGGVIAFAVPIILGAVPGLDENGQTSAAFITVSAIMVVALLIQVLGVKETPTGKSFLKIGKKEIDIDPITFEVSYVEDEKEEKNKIEKTREQSSVYQQIGRIFKAEEKSFAFMLLVVFCAYLGFAAVESFFSSFAKFYMGKADSVAGTLFLAYSVPMILSAYFWGLFGQKVGRKKAAKVGLIGIFVGTLFMSVVTAQLVYDPTPTPLDESITITDIILMINLALISMPWMCFIVNSFPIVWALAPKGKVGTYTGVYYTFNQIAYSISPIILGINLDFFQGLGSRQYMVMFPFVLVCIALSYVFMRKVKRGDVDLDEEIIKEYEEKYAEKD